MNITSQQGSRDRQILNPAARTDRQPRSGPDTDHLHILFVEDVEADAMLIGFALEQAKIRFTSTRVQTREAYIDALKGIRPDAVIADYHLPSFSALEALKIVQEMKLNLPFILVTGSQSEEIAVECIKLGADDYILKQSLTRLPSALLNAINKRSAESEKERAIQDLQLSREHLRALSAHLQSVREEERTRIAREIHDELGQALTALKMDVIWIHGKISDPFTQKNSRQIYGTIKSMVSLIDSTINVVRRIATELRPGVLNDLGLIPAIEWQTQEFEHRTGIRCTFRSSVRDINLDRDRSTAIFRILQETLTNVARHANATFVSIRLEAGADTVALNVIDNGRGATVEEILNQKSLGLLGMKERATLLGGHLDILGAPGIGTTVTVTIPRTDREKGH